MNFAGRANVARRGGGIDGGTVTILVVGIVIVVVLVAVLKVAVKLALLALVVVAGLAAFNAIRGRIGGPRA
jgi:hypothetical protein